MINPLTLLGWRAIPWQIYAGAALVFIAVGLYAYGYQEGKTAAKLETIKSDLQAYREREAIDNETSELSDYDLCLWIGRMPDDCRELQRVD